ncbi:MAG: hypothetical protein ACQ5SW_06685 [Sphaerochaetaceae bacterium]
MTRKRRIIRFVSSCLLIGTILVATSCSAYSKTPAINPDEQHWEGPLLDGTDMEDVQITIKPQQKSVVLNMEDLDTDLSVLMQYLSTGESQEHTFTVEDAGSYILVIKKQEATDNSL